MSGLWTWIVISLYIMTGIFISTLLELFDNEDPFWIVITLLWPVCVVVTVGFFVIAVLPYKLAKKVRNSDWWKKWTSDPS